MCDVTRAAGCKVWARDTKLGVISPSILVRAEHLAAMTEGMSEVTAEVGT